MIKLPQKPVAGSFRRDAAAAQFRRATLDFMRANNLDEGWLAKMCGESPELIAGLLAGKCNSDDERRLTINVNCAIITYRDCARSILQSPFVATQAAETVELTIMLAVRERLSGVVLGETGCGKTTAAQLIALREPGVRYLACNSTDFRGPAFLNKVAAAIGAQSSDRWGTWRLHETILNQMRQDNNIVLVLDDSQLLINPSRPGRSIPFDYIRDFLAIADVPVVLLAVPHLWSTLTSRKTGAWFSQLVSRISMTHTIEADSIERDDVAKFVEAQGMNCSDTVLGALTDLVHRPGAFRNLQKALRWIKRQGAAQITRDSMQKYLRVNGIADIRLGRDEPPSGPPRSDKVKSSAVA